MIVSELIELLQQYPAHLRVVVNGYEEGYDDLSPQQISTEGIVLNIGKHSWEGQHGNPQPAGENPDGAEVVRALVLRRISN